MSKTNSSAPGFAGKPNKPDPESPRFPPATG